MLTVHHLRKSQSERIVWLCEELGIDYTLVGYDRDPVTGLAPPGYKALHPLGAAPVIDDDGVRLAESAAIVEYILARHGDGRLAVGTDAPNYPDYLYWFHYVNGTLQPGLLRVMMLVRGGAPQDGPMMQMLLDRQDLALDAVEARLRDAPYLAGDQITAADIMIVFTLTTLRYFAPFDLTGRPAILAYLQHIAERPAYRTAMEKGDPGMALLST